MRAWVVALALSGCVGSVETPESDPPAIGGPASTAGRGGASGSDAGSGGRAGAPNSAADAGEAPESEPDAGSVLNEPPREYCDAVTLVLRPTCGNGSCHSNRGFANGDFGVGPEEAASYVGRGARNPACGLIIDPRDTSNSLILTKVIGGYPTEVNCGGRMPVGSFEITDEQIDCLEDWLKQFRE